jgi:hypothetical protein
MPSVLKDLKSVVAAIEPVNPGDRFKSLSLSASCRDFSV